MPIAILTQGKTDKACSKCLAVKPVAEFYTHRRFASGLQYWCKECCKQSAREWKDRNKDRARATSLANYYANKPANREHKRAFHLRNPDAAYRYMIRRKYGLTWDVYLAMLASQDHACAVCAVREPGGKSTRWHVDHDHATGVVRALLCAGCNVVLTETMTPERLRALALYLEKHK